MIFLFSEALGLTYVPCFWSLTLFLLCQRVPDFLESEVLEVFGISCGELFDPEGLENDGDSEIKEPAPGKV